MWAAEYLGLYVGRAESVARPLLLEAATHQDSFVRAMALALLQQVNLDRRQLLKVLGRAIKDHDARVKLVVLTTLGQMGADARPLLPEIEKTIKDPDKDVRIMAESAVLKIADAPKK